MAKALMGHVNSELRTTAVLAVENRRLRRRVEDLETLVLRLQADNDRLAAAARDDRESSGLPRTCSRPDIPLHAPARARPRLTAACEPSSLVETVFPARLGTAFRWLVGVVVDDQHRRRHAMAAGPLLVASQTHDPRLVAAARWRSSCRGCSSGWSPARWPTGSTGGCCDGMVANAVRASCWRSCAP